MVWGPGGWAGDTVDSLRFGHTAEWCFQLLLKDLRNGFIDWNGLDSQGGGVLENRPFEFVVI